MNKLHGIIMQPESVEGILAGRKTQTRRLLKPQPSAGVRESPFVQSGVEDGHGYQIKCPYGQVGDILYVKETYQVREDFSKPSDGTITVRYKHPTLDWYEDIPRSEIHPDTLEKLKARPTNYDKWHSSQFMFRDLARIFLRITDIRIQQLQDISEEDALADGGWEYGKCPFHKAPVKSYLNLFEKINGLEIIKSNPFVWAISFSPITKAEALP